ncbi:UNVERIFIED_CONTAM: hypothetical protein ABID98_004654 [Brevibacillus sp. OAP136]
MMSINPPIVDLLEAGCVHWRQGNDPQGVECFQQACLLWLEYMENAEEPQAKYTQDRWQPVLSAIQRLLAVLAENDIAQATDLIQYRITPLVRTELIEQPKGGKPDDESDL